MATIALLGTMDTKGDEHGYVAGLLRARGHSTLVIDVDITIWSDSVELDTGTWVLAGGSDQNRQLRGDDLDQVAAWRQYRQAFAA